MKKTLQSKRKSNNSHIGTCQLQGANKATYRFLTMAQFNEELAIKNKNKNKR